MVIIRLIRKRLFVIGVIFIFGAALLIRGIKISSYPVSMTIDEVAIGFNAYSILNTGKDEWGKKFPLAFYSVGDYKPPVDIYLTVPFIKLFGVTEFAVRFPVVLLGALSAAIFILLLREIGFGKFGSLIGGVWFAFLPWHIRFSRGSFEAVSALFFVLWGTFLVLRSARLKSFGAFILSLVAFCLSVWAYHAERIFTPLLFVFLIIFLRKKINFIYQNKSRLLVCLAVLAVFIVPFLLLTFATPAIRTRALSTSILREASLVKTLHHGNYNSWQEFVFDNYFYKIARHFAGKYLNYYDPNFWLNKGMNFTPAGLPDLGLFYLVDLPFILIGIYAVFTSRNKLLKALTVFWFFAGPIPAALTMNEQHLLRALVWIPFFCLMVASGSSWLWVRLEKRFKLKVVVFSLYSVLLLISFVYFADLYFRQYFRFYSEYLQYGYK